jgi:thiosulfate sulfurtransferase
MNIDTADSLRITAAEAIALIRAEPKVTVFDVRDLASYRHAHIDGAAHLTENRVPAWFRQLPKDAPIVIYCYKGNASQHYARIFADFGYQRAFSVDGGYEALAAA